MNSLEPIPPLIHKVSYAITIWSEYLPDHLSRWHGSLETMAGQQFDFATLAELERLLCELGGWMDPPESMAGIIKRKT